MYADESSLGLTFDPALFIYSCFEVGLLPPPFTWDLHSLGPVDLCSEDSLPVIPFGWAGFYTLAEVTALHSLRYNNK